MQSKVVSGVPPLFSISALSPTNKTAPPPPSFHLSFPLFFLLLCLSVSLSLSLLCPFISPHPSFLSWYFSLERISWQKLPLLGSGKGSCTVGSWRSHRCTKLGFCHVERWLIKIFCGMVSAYLHIHLTRDLTQSAICAFRTVVNLLKCRKCP